MTVKTYPWDPADYLETDEDMAGYLNAALKQDDHRVTALVLSDVARAKGMERAARDAGMDQESLDRVNMRGDKLDFAAFMDMARALDFRLYAGAASCEESASVPNPNGGAAEARRLTQSPNGKPAEDMLSRLNAALANCDAWGAALALRDIAAAKGMERIVQGSESEKRGEMVDFAAFMDAARALGLRIHAAGARVPDRRRGRGAAVGASRD